MAKIRLWCGGRRSVMKSGIRSVWWREDGGGGGDEAAERRAFLVGKATASKDLAPDHIRIRIRVTPA